MEKYEIAHREFVRSISPECMVLLKSDGSFPLTEPGKIALYGNGARKTVKGGTGSGDVNVRSFVNVEEGLKNAGFTITSNTWLDGYDKVWGEANALFQGELRDMMAREGLGGLLKCIGAIMPEPEYELPFDGEGDTAVYILSRNSGEGADRSVKKGDFLLTDAEIRDILLLEEKYERFMLALNVGGVVDLSPVAERVSNILVLSQLGISIGDAFADVLLGRSYPSGKLTTTWSTWDDYCHVGDFAELDDTNYREGIYVGYRYFDTVGKKPIFPFGHGLSYTKFEINNVKASLSGSAVNISANVKNVGSHPGKEVVQIYVSSPEGRLDQPYKTLASFAKTKDLTPGGEEVIDLSFDMRSLSSFDEENLCDILEGGKYVLHIGTSSADTKAFSVVELDNDTIIQRLHDVGGKPDFKDYIPECKQRLTNIDNLPILKLFSENIEEMIPITPKIDEAALDLARSLPDNDLALLCTGAYNGGAGSNSVIGNAGITVAGAAGETTGIFRDIGIPALIMADGPAGIRISPQYGVDEDGIYAIGNAISPELLEIIPPQILEFLGLKQGSKERHGVIHDQYCTAIPIGTAMAQSFNESLCEATGDMVAREMERFGVNIWLAPAMNIHRLPLCGRNFEYYSEDPLLSGKIAAAITRGVEKHPSCGVSIKHFCVNNQETNRMNNSSNVSQRALRDIYLKGFRIVVDEASPSTIMSSYNLLNGEHISERYDLLETLLREEWGYSGIVMSDWVTGNHKKPTDKYDGAYAAPSIKAGNDLMMPGTPMHHENLLGAINAPEAKHPITRENLERCAARMIKLAWSKTKNKKI